MLHRTPDDHTHTRIKPRARLTSRHHVAGFTLIEVAIVFVIVALLLAGVLKGQELLVAARARSLLEQQNGVYAAYYGFLDRFRAPPGDYVNAAAMISGLSDTCGNLGSGNGNGRIEVANGESILVWEHLFRARFLTSAYTCTGNAAVTPESTPRNPYGNFVQLAHDDQFAASALPQHNFKTGNGIPSEVLAEIDRKADDGDAIRGNFRGSAFTSGIATDAGCWNVAGAWSAQPVLPNCGGTSLY